MMIDEALTWGECSPLSRNKHASAPRAAPAAQSVRLNGRTPPTTAQFGFITFGDVASISRLLLEQRQNPHFHRLAGKAVEIKPAEPMPHDAHAAPPPRPAYARRAPRPSHLQSRLRHCRRRARRRRQRFR